MATVVDPGRLGQAKLFTDQYGGNPSSVAYGQALVSYLAPDGWWQYAAWYAPSNAVTLARRHRDEGVWSTVVLPFGLQANDSHNTINMACSGDGRLHIAAGQHNDPLQYTRSYEGFLDDGFDAVWSTSAFDPVSADLTGAFVGDLTYPTFTQQPDGGLLFWWRQGGSGNGVMRAAEYNGTWTVLGDVTSSTGMWLAANGASTSRNFYWTHPIYDSAGVLHVAGTWRESNPSVLCSPGMIANHHIVYVTSDDHGRTWRNAAGLAVGETGVDPIGVSDPVHIPSFANTNLAHQVSDLATGPDRVGILPDYVDPSLLSGSPKCVATMDQRFALAGQGPRWLAGGVWDAEMVKVNGTIVKTGYPTGRKASSRGRMAFSPTGDMVLIFSGFRILSAPPPDYIAWTVDEDGNSAYAYGEVGGLDRSREAEGLLSALFLRRDGAMVVRDILL